MTPFSIGFQYSKGDRKVNECLCYNVKSNRSVEGITRSMERENNEPCNWTIRMDFSLIYDLNCNLKIEYDVV